MDCDFLVVGAGIAGASVACELARHGRVVVLEREEHPGVHSTGRSAALFSETYGTPLVRALSAASRPFYDHPPSGFAAQPVLTPRGAMYVGTPAQLPMLDEIFESGRRMAAGVIRLKPGEAAVRVPVLAPEWADGAVLETGAMDLDVHSIHQGYLRGLKSLGGASVMRAEATAIERRGGRWTVRTSQGEFSAPVLVNAAGAWCDVVAALAGVAAIGLVPKRRTAFIFAPPPDADARDWPLVIAADESFYFKPDAGMLLGSPANADPVPPHDVQAEELDVATAIWRIEQATTMRIRRPTRVWAGLRSFVADGDLVGGFDPDAPGFFWCAAQGGYGIQTAPAMARACAALARGAPIPQDVAGFGVSAGLLSPKRLRPA